MTEQTPSRSPLRWALFGAAGVVGAALAATGYERAAVLAAVAVLIAASLLLEVDLPWGGSVPLGYALLIALAVLVEPWEAALVGAVALALIVPLGRRWSDLAPLAAGIAAAAASQWALHRAIPHEGGTDGHALGEVLVAGGAFLGADLAVSRRKLRQVWPVSVTLLCGAALLAVAYQHSPALSLVAAVPLLVTKYSFGRFTSARTTYAQTTQALSLLPEVAGLTPLGHGERTAVYATALAEELGFDPATVDRIATAARLHHIGYISLHEPEEREAPPDPDELGRLSGDLLRETGFLTDVALLVEQAQSGGAAVELLEAAAIRVCSTLDDLAEGDASGNDPFAEVLSRHPDGLERTAAIALLRLHDRRPDVVDEARAASRVLARVAAAAGDHGHDGEDCR